MNLQHIIEPMCGWGNAKWRCSFRAIHPGTPQREYRSIRVTFIREDQCCPCLCGAFVTRNMEKAYHSPVFFCIFPNPTNLSLREPHFILPEGCSDESSSTILHQCVKARTYDTFLVVVQMQRTGHRFIFPLLGREIQ